MIYKPSSVSPNLEKVENNGLPYFNINIQGISNNSISNKIRISFNDDVFFYRKLQQNTDVLEYKNGKYVIVKRLLYKDDQNYYDKSDYSTYPTIIAETDLSINIDKKFKIKDGVGYSYKVRLYDEDSFNDDSGTNSNDFLWDNCYTTTENDKTIYSVLDYEKLNKVLNTANFETINYIPTSWIGYGTIQDIKSVDINTDTSAYGFDDGVIEVSSSGKFKLIKIFPHAIPNLHLLGSDTCSAQTDYTKGHDTYYGRYYIKINGIFYKILDWRYYDWSKIYITTQVGEGNCVYDGNPDEFPYYTLDDDNNKYYYKSVLKYCQNTDYGILDGYGNPLNLYVLIYGGSDFDIGNKSDVDYTIYSNYIDTDTCSFELTPNAEIVFGDSKFLNSPDALYNQIQFYNSEENAFQNPFALPYSNLDLIGTYFHSLGATLRSFYTKLYIYDNSNKRLINETKTEYGTVYKYSFDEFMNQNKYLLDITLTDSNNITYKKYLYINSNYATTNVDLNVDVVYNLKEYRNKISWDTAPTCIPYEYIENNHAFLSSDIQDWGEFEFSVSEDDDENNVSYDTESEIFTLYIGNNNYIMYDVFGEDELSIPLNGVADIPFILRKGCVYSDTGSDIIEMQFDNNINVKVYWDNRYIIADIDGSKYSYTPYEYLDTDVPYFPEYDYYKDSPYIEAAGDHWYLTMIDILHGNTKSTTSVPFMWNKKIEDTLYDDNLLYIEDNPLTENWWQSVITPTGVLIKKLDDEDFISIGNIKL